METMILIVIKIDDYVSYYVIAHLDVIHFEFLIVSHIEAQC